MRRLALIAVLLAGCGGGGGQEGNQLDPLQLVERLQHGGLVVYLRHGATDQAQEDTDTSNLENCATQRNLSEAGREQARTIGEAFTELGIPVGEVLASEYCRTRETAELAFGRATAEPDLTGFPSPGDPGYDARLARTKELLATAPDEGDTVLVAHVKNIEAAAGVSIEEGELAVFEPHGGSEFTYLGRIPASAWPQLTDELGP